MSALVDGTLESHQEFLPEFVLNREGHKTISLAICKELNECIEFEFSVAFITTSGFSLLLKTLDELNDKNIKGRIITADYLYFNNPEVFEQLLRIPNIEVRCSSDKNFHPKGYIFKKPNGIYSIIIGSANLTSGALRVNTEWNVKLNFLKQGSLFKTIKNEFENQWQRAVKLDQAWIDKYRDIYNNNKNNNNPWNEFIEQNVGSYTQKRFEPNKMQKEALFALNKLRSENKNKALLISATGTGKTFLSAFDTNAFHAKKILFVAHRERLLEDAYKTFKYIYNDSKTYGILSGNNKEMDADILFASSSTLCKPEYLYQFQPNEFDYVIIDEAHHSQANNHLAIIKYFQPKFLLGMTATAYRNDNKDIYELFDHNIAYEITLQKALNENLLCPFRYYGINDVYIRDDYVSSKNEVALEHLIADNRIKYIMSKANYYGCYNNKVQGLIFVSSKKEAKILKEKFNKFGWKTDTITDEDNQKIRNEKLSKLEHRQLDYIISVDVLNEGVDLPYVNQILMLRPTKSPIVFVQQLGRGLRQYKNNFDIKTYVTIIDFIANYNSSFMIPIALSGNKTFNKELLKKDMLSFDYLLNESSIEFDQITEQRIFKLINGWKNNQIIANLNDSFHHLKSILNKIPNHVDFIKFNEIDLRVLIGSKNVPSYLDFLIQKGYWDNHNYPLNEAMLKYIRFIFNEFCDGKNIECIKIIDHILNKQSYEIDDHNFKRLNNSYLINNQGDKYLAILDNKNKINQQFDDFLKINYFYEIIKDLVSFALLNNQKYYSPHNKFTLYEKYTRTDYCKIMKLSNNEPSVINGYKNFDSCMPIFINYQKQKDINVTLDYKDEFLNNNILIWETRNVIGKMNINNWKTFTKSSLFNIYKNYLNGMRVDLFIKKSKASDSDEFFYLGKVSMEWDNIKFHIVKETKNGKVNENTRALIPLKLENPVPENIYSYLVNRYDEKEEYN